MVILDMSAYKREYYIKNKVDISDKRKQKRQYSDNIQEIREKERKASYSLGGRFSHAKSQAKQREIEFTLTKEQFGIAISKPCFYCDNLLGQKSVSGSGLDRLDSNLGYTESNVVSCCIICNQMKSNCLTVEETKVAAQAIINFRKKGVQFGNILQK